MPDRTTSIVHTTLALAGLFFATSLFAGDLRAQQSSERADTPDPPREATAVRAAVAPVIDGRADDAVWRSAPETSDFRQFEPRDDVPARLRTSFRVAYDDHALYVFVRAWDPNPDSIRHALSRRDVRGPSDQLKIIIDGFHDRRSGIELAVNPDGVKRDYSVYDDTNEDGSWNGVWDVATRVDSNGWTAEFRVPFSQLRYDDTHSHVFGFGVWRDVERTKERDSWPRYRTNGTGLMSQLGDLVGIGDIGSARHAEVAPYLVAKNTSRAQGEGFTRAQQETVGADLRVVVTPNVTVNATVNPDFGQVEADPAVVNLSAFETFYQERRPFFVEGTGLYRFELNCYIVHDCGNEGLFYSRRIGREPELLGLYGDDASAKATPIVAAAKVTGRSSGGLSVGVLDAVTNRETGTEGRTTEPLTNYGVVTVQQDLRGGESTLGAIATVVSRSLDRWSAPYLHRQALVAGGRFRHRFSHRRYQISGSFVASEVSGTAAAIAATQRDNVHAFQRPDGPARFDPGRTSLAGTSEELIFGKYGGGILRFETALERQSAGFDPNDLGYLQRADQETWNTWAALTWRRPTRVYRTFQWNFNQWNGWTTDGLRLETAANTNAHLTLLNNWSIHGGVTLSQLGGTFCDRCARGGPALRVSPQTSGWLSVNGDDRRTLVPFLSTNVVRSDGGRSTYLGVSPGADLRLSTRLQASLSVNVSHNVDDAQWYGNYTDGSGRTHYTFAHLDQRTLGVTMQLSYAATPDVAFDLYAQPFASVGTYSGVRELSAAPRATDYADRFAAWTAPAGAPTGLDFRQLRTNAVLRWEYRPGSTVYIVWTHARNGYAPFWTGRSWGAEAHDLFGLYPDNTFLVKVSYWLNR